MEMAFESLGVSKPGTRRFSVLWPILTCVFLVVAVVMTSLFLWMVFKPSREMTGLHDSSENSLCPSQPTLYPLPSPLPKKIQNALHVINDYLVNLVERPEHKPANMSALSIKIFYRNTTLWSGHYGSKTFQGSLTPDDNTRYRIGSVTKIFPVLLLYKLYEDGLISSLDDPLVKYAPEFSIKSPFGYNTNITLRQIASQMSGLPREAPCGYQCANLTTSAQQLALLKSEYLVIKPWTAPSYSNLGYALLGRLLTENLLKISFEQWLKETVLDPLGMNNTGFEFTEQVKKNMAFPYSNEGKPLPVAEIGWARPAGGIYSTVSDLMKLANLFINPEKQSIFKPESIREMLLPDFLTRDGLWLWGSPWEMRFVKHYIARQKIGNIDSYNAGFSVIPEMKLGIAVVMNVATALKTTRSTGFYVIGLIHKTLLPVLNETLFEIQSKASFPIPATPFVGDFLVSEVNMLTGESLKFNVTVQEENDLLHVKFSPNAKSPFSPGFVLKYIGHPLIFQSQLMFSINSSCTAECFGALATVQFDPPGLNALSKGFTASAWKLKAVRLDS